MGILAQFVIMPVLAFLLTMVFQLPPELAVGVILVGSCPGGTSSNVMTYLAKGDVALSVGMTACTTVMAPIVTPLLVLLFAGQTVDVNVVDMFLSIVQVVLVPSRWASSSTTSSRRRLRPRRPSCRSCRLSHLAHHYGGRGRQPGEAADGWGRSSSPW